MADWKKLFDSAVDEVAKGVKYAGEGLRTAADEARKAAGINIGTLELRPSRESYRLGGTVRGTIDLTLTEPIPAKRLVVEVRATRKRTVVERHSNGRTSPVQQRETLFEHEIDVAGESTYKSGQHRFSLELPDAIDAKVEVGGLLGDALRAAQTLRSMAESPIQWTLTAYLDIPWKRNLSKTIDLLVRD